MRDNCVQWGCLLIGLLLGACAPSGTYVTMESDPSGGEYYASNGTYWGYTPVRLYYDTSVSSGACHVRPCRGSRYVTVQGGKVQWESGATTRIPRIRIDRHLGPDQALLFRRPEDAPGLDRDLQWALDLARARVSIYSDPLLPYPEEEDHPMPVFTSLGGGLVLDMTTGEVKPWSVFQSLDVGLILDMTTGEAGPLME